MGRTAVSAAPLLRAGVVALAVAAMLPGVPRAQHLKFIPNLLTIPPTMQGAVKIEADNGATYFVDTHHIERAPTPFGMEGMVWVNGPPNTPYNWQTIGFYCSGPGPFGEAGMTENGVAIGYIPPRSVLGRIRDLACGKAPEPGP